MSEAKWVLVPWVISDEMFDAGFDGSDHQESWRNMLAARPPIPPDVWEQMVERGARAMVDHQHGAGTYDRHKRAQMVPLQPGRGFKQLSDTYVWNNDARRVLRAALGISDE